ncbi:hypothetical protein [Sphaerisporangium sp. TRM90804]|uniref:hypothetical protein n=1 Tax=Sphaerisporangium sp. TRM90804 TaxID=3031113 RepID=UPI00244D431C|nr:hypothetical protein [Sphaerisporangium sp. TRM90804]MDH2428667.1 hypothetical protein [Sphaerisporangium sp. TRM90804]
MSIEWVNGAIEEIRAWGRSKDIAVDVDEVRLLCDYASDYLSVGELADFTPGTFEQLLLDIYPRKVIAPPESAGETVSAARTLVDFLLESGEIGTKMADRMRAKIDEIAPEMPVALADTTKFGMAKSIFAAMGADADATALEADPPHGPAGRYGPEPSRRSRAADGDDCECPDCAPLPAVRLPEAARVAEAVRAVGLLGDAHGVVAWMLEGDHAPTVKGGLRVRDAARVTRDLGVPAPALAWELAVALGLAEVSGASVTAGEGFRSLPSRGERDVLELWAGTVAFLTGGPAASVTGSARLDRELDAVHEALYRSQAPLSLAAVVGDEAAGGEAEELEAAFDALARGGTVERVGDAVRLTPHGLWGLREVYSRMGMDAPLAPDPTEGDAAGLIAALLGRLSAEQAERDITVWLGRRSALEAARELLGAVRGAQAVARGVAVAVVDRLGAEAEPAVRAFLDDAELRPHAAHWLAAHGLDAPVLTPEEVLWVSVDLLAVSVPAGDDDAAAFAGSLAGAAPSAHVIEEMWRVDHPDVAEVLDLLGRHLPDRNLAKAARKAAFKARSRGIH